MKIPKPNYTQIPNVILDNQQHFTDAQFRILICVCRETFGWHREAVKITISNLMEKTGMSRQGVVRGIQPLVEIGLLERTEIGNSFAYSIAVDCLESCMCNPNVQVTEGDRSDGKSVTEGDRSGEKSVTEGDCPLSIKKCLKESLKERPTSAALTGSGDVAPDPSKINGLNLKKAKNPSDPRVREFSTQWCEAYRLFHGRSYVHGGAKDTVAIKRMLDSGYEVPSLLAVAQEAWKHPEEFNCKQAATIKGMACRLNDMFQSLRGFGIGPDGNALPPKEWTF